MNAIEVPSVVILDNLYINVVVGRDLLDKILRHYGPDGWNAYVRKLQQHNIWAMYSTPEPTEDDDHCMPVCIQVDWRGLSFQECDLSRLDLTIPMMEDCNFDGTNLAGAQIGGVAGSTFRGADLRDACFQDDISGCDFTEAEIAGASFDDAIYHRDIPPLALPQQALDSCHLYPPHWERDEEPKEEELRYPLTAKSIELRSFWGPLPQ